MTTPVFDIEGMEGATVTVRVQVQDSDATVADLTSYTGTMQVRADPLADDVLATGTVAFPGSGIVIAQIAAADTVDWSAGFYDVRIEAPTGEVEFVARGKITLAPAVTQA